MKSLEYVVIDQTLRWVQQQKSDHTKNCVVFFRALVLAFDRCISALHSDYCVDVYFCSSSTRRIPRPRRSSEEMQSSARPAASLLM